MTESMRLEDVARRALDGDRDALEQLVRDLQGDIYGLALRMLWSREDAEDATQEILVRAITRLAQFDFRSKLKTWVYRIAVNYVLDMKKSPVERLHLTFERFADDLAEGLSSDEPADAERSLLTEEVKIGFLHAHLLWSGIGHGRMRLPPARARGVARRTNSRGRVGLCERGAVVSRHALVRPPSRGSQMGP